MITLVDQTLWMLTMLYVVSCLAIVILWIRRLRNDPQDRMRPDSLMC